MFESPPVVSVKAGTIVSSIEACALLHFQVYFLLHEREGARGDGCFTPYQRCFLPRRSSVRRPQGGAVSQICREFERE